MSGRVIHKPERVHHCNPGVTYREITEADTRGEHGLPLGLVGHHFASPPDRLTHPPGTLWACDCGRVWEAWRPGDAAARGDVGSIWWRQLSRFQLWRMRRRAA